MKMITIEISHNGTSSKFDYPDTFSAEMIGKMVEHYLDLYKLTTKGVASLPKKSAAELGTLVDLGMADSIERVRDVLKQAQSTTPTPKPTSVYSQPATIATGEGFSEKGKDTWEKVKAVILEDLDQSKFKP